MRARVKMRFELGSGELLQLHRLLGDVGLGVLAEDLAVRRLVQLVDAAYLVRGGARGEG